MEVVILPTPSKIQHTQKLKNINAMKTRIFLLIAGAAVVTLSFTFATSTHVEKKEVATQAQNTGELAGGYALEDK